MPLPGMHIQVERREIASRGQDDAPKKLEQDAYKAAMKGQTPHASSQEMKLKCSMQSYLGHAIFPKLATFE